MASKNKNYDTVEIEGEILNGVSYSTYYCGLPLFTSFRIFNRGGTAAGFLKVSVSGSTNLILPAEAVIEEIPPESSVEVVPQNLLNPKYLAELEAPEKCTVFIKVTEGKSEVCNLQAEVTALPIDFWSGLSGNVEMLACFVRPKLADCQKILAEAGLQLKTWGYSSEFTGYAGNDKNAVRNAVASVYAAIRRLNIECRESPDLSAGGSAGNLSSIVKDASASSAELALFAASCLEAAKLNPVIVLGKSKICVGVWLYESCFSSPLQDDMSLVEKYVYEGVNNLALFDVDDIFAHKNASYTTSEAHALNALRSSVVEICLDIKRCRIGGLYSLPLKIKTSQGYEILSAKQFSYDEKPRQVLDASRYEYDKDVSKDVTWQRKLLDLTLKNNLVNFRCKREIGRAHV